MVSDTVPEPMPSKAIAEPDWLVGAKCVVWFWHSSTVRGTAIFSSASRGLFQHAHGNRGVTPRRAKKTEPPPAKDGPGKLGSNCQTVGGYAELIVEVTVLKVALICEPSPRAAAMMPTAIRAAMRPYSMAVAPELVLYETLDVVLHDALPRAWPAFPCPDAGYGTVVCESLTGGKNLTEW